MEDKDEFVNIEILDNMKEVKVKNPIKTKKNKDETLISKKKYNKKSKNIEKEKENEIITI
jgi:hypothetical protein